MSRPTTLLQNNTLYWTIRLYNDSQVLVDADSTPTVAVRKNGAAVGDAVTVTKRSATTGTYDCSYNPAGEVEGDQFTLEESATVSSQAYENSWSVVVEAVAFDASSDTVTTDTASRDASKADVSGLSTFDPSSDTVANVTTTGSVTSPVATDTASRDASKADVSGLSTFDPSADTVARVTLVDTTTDLTNQQSGSSGNQIIAF